MLRGHRIAVVVPAYQEERLVARTLASVPSFVDRVIVVDDASTDETRKRASSVDDPRVEIVSHPQNQGVGAAIVTGYAIAFSSGADIAVVMAADAQMDPRDLPQLLEPVLSRRAGYAKGNRLAWPDASRRMPLTRYAGNRALSMLTRLGTGLCVEDTQCGYTALHKDAAAQLSFDRLWPRYGYPNDLLTELALRGIEIVDVPVRPVYGEERSGVGLRHALGVVPWVITKGALRRLSFERTARRSEASISEAVYR